MHPIFKLFVCFLFVIRWSMKFLSGKPFFVWEFVWISKVHRGERFPFIVTIDFVWHQQHYLVVLSVYLLNRATFYFDRLLAKEVETYQNKLEVKTKEWRAVEQGKENNVCELCHKTKFSEGIGKECKYCRRRVCSQCGETVTFPSRKQVRFIVAMKLNVLI